MSEVRQGEPVVVEAKKREFPALFRLNSFLRNIFLATGAVVLSGIVAQADQESQQPETRPNLAHVELAPDPENREVANAIVRLELVRSEHAADPDGHFETIIIGDSVAEPLDPVSTDGGITFINWSARSRSFQNYPDPDNPDGYIQQGELLERIDDLEDQPEFVALMFGRNDANRINIQAALNLLGGFNADTSRINGSGYEEDWLNEIFSLIDELESRGIVVIIVGSTPTPTHNSGLVNDILLRVAQLKGLPFLDGGETARHSAGEYPFTYGSRILTDEMQTDGIHYDSDVYDNFDRFFANSISHINQITLPQSRPQEVASNSTQGSTRSGGQENTVQVTVSNAVRNTIRNGLTSPQTSTITNEPVTNSTSTVNAAINRTLGSITGGSGRR